MRLVVFDVGVVVGLLLAASCVDAGDDKALNTDTSESTAITGPSSQSEATTSETTSMHGSEASSTLDDSSTDLPTTSWPPLRIAVTTQSYAGQYAPDNVGAVWIEDQHGVFVRSLEVWAKVRKRNLLAWKASSAGNILDAVTSATWTTHGLHELTWNGNDHRGFPVPAGTYRLRGEMAEDDAAEPDIPDGPTFFADFTLQVGQPITVHTQAPGFARIDVSAAGTAVN